MKELLMNELIKFLVSIIGLVSTYVLVLFGNFINEKKKLIEKQGKSEQYNYALSIARGLYTLFEKQFADVEKAGSLKREAMENYLISVIPELDKEEIDSVIHNIWAEFNKDVVQPIVTPIQEEIPQVEEVKPVESQPVSQEVQDTIKEMHNDEPEIKEVQ